MDGYGAEAYVGHDVPVPPSTAASSTPGSTDSAGKSAGSAPAKVVPTDPTLYIELGSVAFAGIGLVLHQRLTPGDDHDAFIPDQQDTAAVITPLASIAARRSPLVGGAANDVTDGLAALIGGIGYVMKSVTKWREVQRRRKQTSGWTGQADAGGQPAAHVETPAVDEQPPADPFVTFDPGASPLSGLGTHVGE